MSSDDTPHAPSGDDSSTPSSVGSSEVASTAAGAGAPGRRDAVREKAQQVQVKQTRVRVARRSAIVVVIVALVAVVGVAVAWTVGGAASKPQLSPDSANHDGFVVTTISRGAAVASPDDGATPDATQPAASTPSPRVSATSAAPVNIHVYVDYLSPSGREWQLANSAQLSSWVADGAVTLTYHPVAMLTAKSNGTKYSLRAANAAACVGSYSPNSFFTFNDDLLSRQPAVDSDGFSDKDLADIAQANGGEDPKALRECIETERYASWVKAATERAVAGVDGSDGVALSGNAMITVNGQPYQGDMGDAAEFSQFVLTSASGKSAKAAATASPTPSPSTTP
ncbi:thioredoxin domain-containing protein [Microbacterium dextranolyticum]|uniref:Thioredoxin-like fold domain-containing protein n=1 Tax=Microbacterium dextranolyticum TaxID=36806 RepID=A0A9W6HLD4_9MICO|nr:thioredoxin domain-containing protein [Microbacterium dextranolyticum]MBM7463560.1 protein-disulfide isomerase [Microbacterium dextranolyticum]GLJ94663.1 hypothetical protein GCM10017591_07240 [Microbacterium dextranolyticum]